jgi:hypothetical protein
MRRAVLNANPAIKAAYFGVIGDPVTMNGLPTSQVSDMGNNFTVRAQRVVIQQWKVAVPWAAAGEVTFGLGGSIAKETGLLPLGSSPGPGPTSTVCAGPPTIGTFAASPASIIGPLGSSTLSWGAVTNADHVFIDQGIGDVAAPGSVSVSPNVDTTYTLTATGCGGTASKQATINVTGLVPITPLPLTRDLSAGNMSLNPAKQINVVVSRTGIWLAGSTFKWKLYRHQALPSTGWSEVASGVTAVPASSVTVNTGYTVPAIGLVGTFEWRFVIDPDNEIAESNEGNNVRQENCSTSGCS